MKLLHRLGGEVIFHILKIERKLVLLAPFAITFHISLKL